MTGKNTTSEQQEYNLSVREQNDFETRIEELRSWLGECGKDVDDEEGYSPSILPVYCHHLKNVYQWVWNKKGYCQYIRPDQAREYVEALDDDVIKQDSGEDYSDSSKRKRANALEAYFKWLHIEKGRESWECSINFDEQRTGPIADPFTRDERDELRNAVMSYGSIPRYNDLSTTERTEWKKHISQRLGKPKDEVSPEDWERINTDYKWVSLINASLDAALRPCEIKRAKTDWHCESEGTLHIPKEEAAKNREFWKPALRSDTNDALTKWIEQRSNIDKYDEDGKMWLTRESNPYSSGSLNYHLRKLLSEAGIEPDNRSLSWYSFRHSTGTYLESEAGLLTTRNQLRHKSVDSTKQYTHPTPEETREALERI